jgi:hypothetical protein
MHYNININKYKKRKSIMSFELTLPSFSFKEISDEYLYCITDKTGMEKIIFLSNWFHTRSQYMRIIIDSRERYIIRWKSHDWLYLSRKILNIKENHEIYEYFEDFRIPHIFYDIIFDEKYLENFTPEFKTFNYVKNELLLDKDKILSLLDNTYYDIIKIDDFYKTHPETKLFFSMFEFCAVHSRDFGNKFLSFVCENSYISLFEDEVEVQNSDYHFCPRAFLTPYHHNMFEDEDQSLFYEWCKNIEHQQEVFNDVNCLNNASIYELNAPSAVFETRGICNLNYIYQFCKKSLLIDTERHNGFADLEILLDMFELLKKFDYIPSIKEFLDDVQDRIDSYQKITEFASNRFIKWNEMLKGWYEKSETLNDAQSYKSCLLEKCRVRRKSFKKR